MSKGYVYILTNPSLREVSCGEREVKERVPPVMIGMTKDVPHRMGTLNTSTPQNFVDELIVELSEEKRNSKDAYQGPKYFTFKGEPLTDLRAKLEK